MKKEEMNIYQKMSAITNELRTVAKNLNVEIAKGKSYKAVSEKDVLDAIKPLEEKYGIYSYPIDSEITDRDILVKENEYNGNITRTNTLFMRLERTYRFINIDKSDEYIDIKSYGDGLDTGDKAPGKAMTYADKYALMKAYKITTGDDSDAESSPEKGYSKVEEKPKAEPKKTTTEPPKPVETPKTEDELMSLEDKTAISNMIAENGLEASIIVEISKSLGYASPVEIRAKDKDAIIAAIQEKVKEKEGK